MSKKDVAQLLRSFIVPFTEYRFQPGPIADLLDRMPAGVCDLWDVAFPDGDGAEVTLGGRTFLSLKRRVLHKDSPGVLIVSGGKRRVGSRGGERAGLSSDEAHAAYKLALEDELVRANAEGREPRKDLNLPDRFFRRVRKRPLLLLYVLDPTLENPSVEGATNVLLPEGTRVVGIGLSFPVIAEGTGVLMARYKINLIYARELYLNPTFQGDDESFTEEPV